MGTIIRIADWFGYPADRLLPGQARTPTTPKPSRPRWAALVRIPVIVHGIAELLDKYPEIPSYAATLHGDNIVHTKTIREGIILIGNNPAALARKR